MPRALKVFKKKSDISALARIFRAKDMAGEFCPTRPRPDSGLDGCGVHQRRGQRAQCLAEEFAHLPRLPIAGTRPAQGSSGGRIIPSEYGALHKNRPLRHRQLFQPITQSAAARIADHPGKLAGGDSG